MIARGSVLHERWHGVVSVVLGEGGGERNLSDVSLRVVGEGGGVAGSVGDGGQLVFGGSGDLAIR